RSLKLVSNVITSGRQPRQHAAERDVRLCLLLIEICARLVVVGAALARRLDEYLQRLQCLRPNWQDEHQADEHASSSTGQWQQRSGQTSHHGAWYSVQRSPAQHW